MKNSCTDATKGYRLASWIYDPVVERFMSRVRERTLEIANLKPGHSLLDICCGTGTQAELFSRTGARVSGIELSGFMIAKARRKENEHLTFTQADATATGFGDSMFDFATTGFSLHEVEEPIRDGFLNEMIRVTKPGGALIFTDFSVQTGNGFRNRARKAVAHFAEWFAGAEHFRNYQAWMNLGGLDAYLDGKGLPIQTQSPLNGGHILIAKVVNFK